MFVVVHVSQRTTWDPLLVVVAPSLLVGVSSLAPRRFLCPDTPFPVIVSLLLFVTYLLLLLFMSFPSSLSFGSCGLMHFMDLPLAGSLIPPLSELEPPTRMQRGPCF